MLFHFSVRFRNTYQTEITISTTRGNDQETCWWLRAALDLLAECSFRGKCIIQIHRYIQAHLTWNQDVRSLLWYILDVDVVIASCFCPWLLLNDPHGGTQWLCYLPFRLEVEGESVRALSIFRGYGCGGKLPRFKWTMASVLPCLEKWSSLLQSESRDDAQLRNKRLMNVLELFSFVFQQWDFV